MGLELVGYRLIQDCDWCGAYSTFDSLRAIHREAVGEAFAKDGKYFDKIEEHLRKHDSWLELDEVQEAFYEHSDCDGMWNSLEVQAICVYLQYTREVFKKYADDNYDYLDLVDSYDALVTMLEKSDVIEFC